MKKIISVISLLLKVFFLLFIGIIGAAVSLWSWNEFYVILLYSGMMLRIKDSFTTGAYSFDVKGTQIEIKRKGDKILYWILFITEFSIWLWLTMFVLMHTL